ncbi:peptide MFS transporter [Dokdonella fugitiva]|uniref:peptide MFS transporter n=1 Tax=Dokdonella fugitiva TaxID=328517 RepID=UPI0015F7D2CA|nr:oligopeptide:H+ symporter [Dokdonella fugitiva]MBA8884168.1 POT family proton-dependent oligopeptide transporter [Dokdonella fugitiva]
MSTATLPHHRGTEFLGHPKGLYVCFLTEMWERFSFYGMKALLLLYLVKYHLFTDDNGYNLVGAYGGLVYATPVIGGLLADRWLGMRKAVVFGGILLVLGHLGMAIEGHPATSVNGTVVRDTHALQVFYFSLALIILGVGFLKPNISTIVGKLYGDNDPRRESGFTLFYAGINLGGTFSGILCGWLGETYGWGWGFGAAGIGMLAGLANFLYGQKYLLGHAEPPDPARLRARVFGPLTREHLIYLASIAGLVVIWGLIQAHSLFLAIIPDWFEPSPVLLGMHLIGICLLGGILWFMFARCTKTEREQMFVVLAFIAFCLVFFTIYEQTYGSWVLFSDRVMNHRALGAEWSASELTSLGSFFILALAPIFAWLWPRLERAGWNPSKPAKSGYGLILAGVAFLVLVWSARHPEANGLTSIGWFVFAYFVLEVGEMLLSPIGLSAVTELSVPRVTSLMMGGWFLGTSYSEVLAAALGKLSSIEIPEGGTLDVADALAKYDALFVFSAKIGIGSGILVLLLTPLIKRWMHGVR